ncbi:MAG: protein phosphatase CheZ [Alphaproteobacteria bacterium]
MQEPMAHDDMDRHLAELRKRRVYVNPQDILEIVESVMGSLHGDGSTLNGKLHTDIEALANYIGTVKAEIADIRADKINAEYVPTASDELNAIVGATEVATESIFEAVERIEELSQEMTPDMAEQVAMSVTSIYEACGFQDITGQRITKIVKALQSIEEKVNDLLVAFGEEGGSEKRERQAEPEITEFDEKSLMGGPQLPEKANSQAEIDALLASFD